jgi:hypothetical protein
MLLFLAVDQYKVQELCHHHYHFFCMEAMEKSPKNGMNSGMQGFLISDTSVPL